MSRLSRLKLSARLCNLGLNSDAARSLARLMSRFSKRYVQTFHTQTLGATIQFGSKFGCGATHDHTFQNLCPDFLDSNSRREKQFESESGCGATRGATMVVMARTLRPRRRRRKLRDQVGEGATFQTKAETARLSMPSDQSGPMRKKLCQYMN